MSILKLVFTFVFLFLNIALADMFSASHGCYSPTKPYKPYSFNSQWEVDSYNNSIRRYNNEVSDYKNCINDFIEEQNRGIKNHQTATQNAIDDWNLFISFN